MAKHPERLETQQPTPVTEPMIVVDTFASGVLLPEDAGGHIRLVCYQERQMPDLGTTERIVVVRLVFPREAFFISLEKLYQEAARQWPAEAARLGHRLM